MLLCKHGFCDVSVTLYNISVTLSPALSKKILDDHPWSDYTELAEAAPIGPFVAHHMMYLGINRFFGSPSSHAHNWFLYPISFTKDRDIAYHAAIQ